MRLDIDAGGARRRLVVADHQRVAAEPGVGEDVVGDQRHADEDENRHGHAERDGPGRETSSSFRQSIDRLAVGQHQGGTAGEAEHAQGHDERRDFGARHQKAVDQRRRTCRPCTDRPAPRPARAGPALSTASAPTTPEKPTTEPSDRSRPAEQITKVAPIASTPITAVASRMFRMLETEKKIRREEQPWRATSRASTPRLSRRTGERSASARQKRGGPLGSHHTDAIMVRSSFRALGLFRGEALGVRRHFSMGRDEGWWRTPSPADLVERRGERRTGALAVSPG